MQSRTWSLSELAEETGLSQRTIRYYISLGLLEGPAVAGRGAAYSSAHLERLRTIQKLQAGGVMLSRIGRMLAGEGDKPAPAAETWRRYQLDEDVVVMVRGDVSPWRSREVVDALTTFAAHIRRKGQDATDK